MVLIAFSLAYLLFLCFFQTPLLVNPWPGQRVRQRRKTLILAVHCCCNYLRNNKQLRVGPGSFLLPSPSNEELLDQVLL
jgi:hypothetical protein